MRYLIILLVVLSGCRGVDLEDLTNRVVSLRTMRGHGTGFNVKTGSGAVYTLTNKHVCVDLNFFGELIATNKNGNSQFVGVLVLAPGPVDLCLLTPVSNMKPFSLARSVKYLQHATEVGFPLSRLVTVSDGLIYSDYNMPYFQERVLSTGIPSFPGNSGSPVIDDNGDLISVMEISEIGSNLGYGVSFEALKTFLEEF